MNEDIESAHPMDKKGKQYVLPNIEYQQVRKWVLTHFPENADWEEKYQVYLHSQKSRVDPDTNLVFVNLGRFMRNTSEVDEPFILVSEAKQVFYCQDLSRDNWHVVLDAPKRLSQEIDAYEDPLVFEARTSANDSSSTTLIKDVLEVAEDWI
ncbi:hypothetical protein IFM89_014437 [Coptis chinensis]|uniref:DUF4216 domain-containing protein n=1 Tax=Coptis chinensis TaxID=261450 RepID=A0A835I3D2_9MAGN|nr:hypothetical protein IFM89_014437 [Coptis chinensis]